MHRVLIRDPMIPPTTGCEEVFRPVLNSLPARREPRCGAVIRRMHDLGVFHADLQVENLLVGDSAVHIIDFDNATIKPVVTRAARSRNLLRLKRSFEKRGLPLEAFELILGGYAREKPPQWLETLYALKNTASDALSSPRRRAADEPG